MHASAAPRRAATLFAAHHTALPGAEAGAGAAAPPGLTFAEQLGQRAAAGAAAAQLVDAALQARPELAADAVPAELPQGAALSGDAPPALPPSWPTPHTGATAAAPETVETGAATRLREFIAQLLPSDATPVPADAALAPDAAAVPHAEPQTTAALCASTQPARLVRADSILAPQALASPRPVLATAPAAPLAAPPGTRAAMAQAAAATGKAARPDLASAKSSSQLALLRERQTDDLAVETSAAASPDPGLATPERSAAQSLAETQAVDDTPRDAAQNADNPATASVAPWVALTLQPPPSAQTPEGPKAAALRRPSPEGIKESGEATFPCETRAVPATGNPTRFERLDALPSRYASAPSGGSRTPSTTDEGGALPEFAAAPRERGPSEARRQLALAPELGAGLALAAQAPTTSAEMPAGLRVAANPAQEWAAPNTSPNTAPMSGAAALVPIATPVSNALPLHVELAVPVASPQFRDAFALQVSVLARDGVQHAQVQLNPAELGPISVQIALDGQQAQIHFGCESAQTRGLVEAGLPALAAQLRDAGLTLSGGGVSQHTPGQRHDFNPGREHRRSASEPDEAAAPPLVRTLRVATGRLDTYA